MLELPVEYAPMRRVAILTAALALASAAHAQEAMSTAGASGSPPTDETARLIERWLADSPAARAPEDGALTGLVEEPDRKIHGEVGVAIGTGGYRSGYITTVMPVGETGTLALTLGQEKNGFRRYGYGPYGYGPYGSGYWRGAPGFDPLDYGFMP